MKGKWLYNESESDYAMDVKVVMHWKWKWLYTESGSERDYNIKWKWLYHESESESDFHASESDCMMKVKMTVTAHWK